MIEIIKQFKDSETMKENMRLALNALAGSSAYARGEVTLCATGENEFTLCVGSNDNYNLRYYHKEEA